MINFFQKEQCKNLLYNKLINSSSDSIVDKILLRYNSIEQLINGKPPLEDEPYEVLILNPSSYFNKKYNKKETKDKETSIYNYNLETNKNDKEINTNIFNTNNKKKNRGKKIDINGIDYSFDEKNEDYNLENNNFLFESSRIEVVQKDKQFNLDIKKKK